MFLGRRLGELCCEPGEGFLALPQEGGVGVEGLEPGEVLAGVDDADGLGGGGGAGDAGPPELIGDDKPEDGAFVVVLQGIAPGDL